MGQRSGEAGSTPTDRARTPSPRGVLCVVARHDDVLIRFGPSLRWFDQSGVPFHVLEFSTGPSRGHAATRTGPRPTSVLDLVLRCPLEQIPTPVLAGFIDRAAVLTGAGGILTYRHSTDFTTGRALREIVDQISGQRGVPVWIRDRKPPPHDDAPLRPIKARRHLSSTELYGLE